MSARNSGLMFIDDNGRTVCNKHAGHYLSAELEQAPGKEMYFTPRGSYADVSNEADIECESCEAGMPFTNDK